MICEVIEALDTNAESNVHINILQGLPKADKMELVIQKGTELGVKEFTPVNMERCVVKISSKDEKKKIERWQKIAEVAAKQSGRDIIPKINNIENLKQLKEVLNGYDAIIVAYENEKEYTMKRALDKIKKDINNGSSIKIAILIGPEGGVSEQEVQYMKDECNAIVVTLGKRILRTETVALVMSGIIMYEFEEN